MSRCVKCWSEAERIRKTDERELMVIYAEQLREHDHGYRSQPIQICEWTQDADGVWQTQCNNAFEFTTGTPDEHGCEYCLYCGARLRSIPFVDEAWT